LVEFSGIKMGSSGSARGAMLCSKCLPRLRRAAFAAHQGQRNGAAAACWLLKRCVLPLWQAAASVG
jgi:hypothetical protein